MENRSCKSTSRTKPRGLNEDPNKYDGYYARCKHSQRIAIKRSEEKNVNDSSGTEEIQNTISRLETKYGFDTTKFVERVRDANDEMLDVSDISQWFEAHRTLSRMRMERRMRGAWEASGMDSEFNYLDSCVDRRERKRRETAETTK